MPEARTRAVAAAPGSGTADGLAMMLSIAIWLVAETVKLVILDQLRTALYTSVTLL